MSQTSGIRAASIAQRKASTQPGHDRARNASASSIQDKPRAPLLQNTLAGNHQERRSGRRSPTEALKQKDSARSRIRDEVFARHVPSARKLASEAPRPPASWSPQASLVSTSTAPLATRISVAPLSALAPKELQPQPLNTLSLAEQESAMLEDLLFVFMGFEGQYIRFSESYNPLEEKDRLAGPDFRISPGLDLSLRDLTNSMLKIPKYYIALEAFTDVQSREDFGSVNHALCAAMRKLLKDFLVLVAQLEHQSLTNDSFTLHVMNLHTNPSAHILAQLYSLAQEILKRNSILEEDLDDSDDLDDVNNIIESLRDGGDGGGAGGKKVCKGGSVLGLITTRLASLSGDPAARELLTQLLRDASRPYMRMLNEWLHHGAIRDPHSEFLIREQKSIRREGLEQDYTDEYWDKRYTIREADVPPQLESVKEKVLLAGKYLNVVRECGGVDVSQEVRDVPPTFDDVRFLDNVNGAYANANSSLLALLLTTHSLPARLRSLKHYFFLDRSDFFSYFLELGTSELHKPARTVNTGKLQSLLDIAIRQPGSVAAEDPFKEDVKVQMNDIGLTNWLMRVVNVTGIDQEAANTSMTNLLTPAAPAVTTESDEYKGFDALVFDYSVPFPLSLVISRVTLTRYQLLFRYLLSLRHLETLLAGSWTEHSKSMSWRHKSSNPKIERWKRKAWTLRARMLVFVQQLLYFCTAEVIEPNWQALMARLNEPKDGVNGSGPAQPKRTVDELMQDHVDFLATCLKECMLTNAKLLKINKKILDTCTMFAKYTTSLSRYLYAADADLSLNPPKTIKGNQVSISAKPGSLPSHDPSKLNSIVDTLDKYEYHFSKHLKILLDMLNYLAATETVVFLGLCARLSQASEGGPGAPGNLEGSG